MQCYKDSYFFMMNVALGEFSSRKFLASTDMFTLYESFLMLESIIKETKLQKGEGWRDNNSGNEEIHCTEMIKIYIYVKSRN